MIYTERKVTIKNDVATIDMPIILFRGDREVEIQFTIIDSKFKFESNRGNVIDKTQATYGQLAVALPDGTDLFTEIVECENGVVIFSISGEMIDEIHEVGLYSFHIRLYNDDKTSRITLPPVMNGIEIKEPLIIEDDVENTDLVGDATVGYSMIQTLGVEENTFDEYGNYIPTEWAIGDKITANKLNKMEEAISNNSTLYSRLEALEGGFSHAVKETLRPLLQYGTIGVTDGQVGYGQETYPNRMMVEFTVEDAPILFSCPLDVKMIYNRYNKDTGSFIDSSGLDWVTEIETKVGYKYIVVMSWADDRNIDNLNALYDKVNVISKSNNSYNQWNGKQWYAYGTSMTSTSQGTYAPYLAALSGLILTNHGIPGGSICPESSSAGNIKAAVLTCPYDVDLVTLEVVPNDGGVALGDIYDTGNDTFAGNLHQCIKYLQENTRARIVILICTQSRYDANNPTTVCDPTYERPNGKTWYDAATLTKQVANLHGVPCWDASSESGLGYYRMGEYGNNKYLVDQIHLTNLGGYNVAQYYWSQLKNLPNWYIDLP